MTETTSTSPRMCDYCGEHPVASDYGACAECKRYHDHPDNFNGPKVYRADGSRIPDGSVEYDAALEAIHRSGYQKGSQS